MRVNDDHSNVQWRMPGVQPQSLALAQPELKCPCCGETQQERLHWLDMERVRCMCCGATFHVWANRAD